MSKPKKKDFTDMREFLRASAAWAEENMKEWPWGGPKDEDDEYYFVAIEKQHSPALPNDDGDRPNVGRHMLFLWLHSRIQFVL